MMNIHHLELFYYVARHGGISEAVRNMPYGIQQPAMSSQVILLEQNLGVTLFQRRPFQLTPAGEELFAFIKPFFDNVEPMAARLRGGGRYEHLRIGAAEIILRDHLPAPLRNLRRKFPELKVTLRSAYLPQLEIWLQKKEIDFAVTLLDGKQPAGITAQPLLKLSSGLLVSKDCRINSAGELWRRDKIDEQLIALPLNEPITRSFQQHLGKLGVDWFPSIEVSSLDVLEAYVGNGYGIGLTLVVPKTPPPAKARLLPLPDFPLVTIGAMWTGKPTPIIQALLNELQERAKQLTT
jgi:DNA-binding transcriptional LysR family regulator